MVPIHQTPLRAACLIEHSKMHQVWTSVCHDTIAKGDHKVSEKAPVRCKLLADPWHISLTTQISRLVDLDDKIQGILDKLGSTQSGHSAASPTRLPDPSQNNGRHTHIPTPSTAAGGSLLAQRQPSHDEDYDMSSMPPTDTTDWASRLAIDRSNIDLLLDRHRITQHHFPFVLIPAAWSTAYMLDNRPILLLAAVSNAAADRPDLQERLARELKGMLAQQIVIEGETSLDLLQSLLVHLAWYMLQLHPVHQPSQAKP